MTTKIPHLLASQIRLQPTDSLVLLTGVLNANANWLLLRYLYAALVGVSVDDDSTRITTDSDDAKVKVVFVSWMREWEFWKSEARRALGFDLAKQQQSNRIAFVDGLTDLFAGDTQPATAAQRQPQPRPSSSPQPAVRSDGLGGRKLGEYSLSNPSLEHFASVVNKAIDDLLSRQSSNEASNSQTKVLLMLDTPSLILQTSTPHVSATSLLSAITALRSRDPVHSAIVSVPADAPLLALSNGYGASSGINFTASVNSSVGSAIDQFSAMRDSAAPATPLETENAAFVIALAHQSHLVLSCRMLGTGFAEDVSGVIRATRGGAYSLGRQEHAKSGAIQASAKNDNDDEGEWLYYISRDGSVKAWRRGGSD